jgi:hypothetical protein
MSSSSVSWSTVPLVSMGGSPSAHGARGPRDGPASWASEAASSSTLGEGGHVCLRRRPVDGDGYE